jgi:hypothetical protein
MFTTAFTDRVLNTWRATNLTAPANTYAGLLTVVTDQEAGTVTETSYSGYARQAITFGAPAAALGGRKIENTGALTFPAKGDAGSVDILAVGIYDSLTTGELWGVIYLYGSDAFIAVVDGTSVTNDTLIAPAHGLANDTRVRVERIPGGGSVPAGLSEDTTYWVVSSATDTFKLAATQGGAAIDLTAKGGVLVLPLAPVTINQNDQPQFAASALRAYLD